MTSTSAPLATLPRDQSAIRGERTSPPGGETCLLLHDALAPAECRAWIASAEGRGYAPTGAEYPPSYRDNDRLMFDDPDLAAGLFARLAAHLPARIERDGAAWTLVDLNARFRGCRYRAGQRFGRHRDGPYARGDDERSLLVVMLYLNDASEFSGGATRFFVDRDAPDPWLAVPPRAGTAIVFDHALWHEGEAVPRGTKYVLRTDVMYRREAPAVRAQAPREDLVRADEQVLAGHAGYVWQVRRLRDGRLASAGRDGTVRAWRRDGDVWAADRVVRAHAASVIALLEAPDGALWTGDRDGALRTWLPEDQGGWSVGPEAARPGGAVLTLAAAGPDLVAVGSSLGRITLLDLAGRLVRSIDAHHGWIWALTPATDGTLLSAGEDGAVRRWCPRNGALVETVHEGGDPVRALAVTDDGVVVWGTAAGVVARSDGTTWTAHTGAVRALLTLPAGRLASGGEDDRVRVWTATGAELASWSQADFVTSLADAGDGLIASASYDGTVRVRPGRPSMA